MMYWMYSFKDRGKTTLSHAIRGTACPSHKVATDGVDITECKIPSPATRQILQKVIFLSVSNM